MKENALIFIDLKNKIKYNSSEQSDLVIEVLWYLSDLLIMHKNKTDPLSEVSQKTEEDRNDVIALEMKIHRLIAWFSIYNVFRYIEISSILYINIITHYNNNVDVSQT